MPSYTHVGGYFSVISNPSSAPQYHRIADRGAASDPYLGANNTVLTDSHVVSDLDLIIYLGVRSDGGHPNSSAINRSARSDLNVIAYYYSANLGNFSYANLSVCKVTETISAYY